MKHAHYMIMLSLDELDKAYDKHGRDKWGRHEFYAVFKEEVDEVWDIIKADGSTDDLVKELSHCVAMILRYYETGNRYGVDL